MVHEKDLPGARATHLPFSPEKASSCSRAKQGQNVTTAQSLGQKKAIQIDIQHAAYGGSKENGPQREQHY